MSARRSEEYTAGERFAALAEAMPHLVWLADAQGEIVYVNERFRAYTGFEFGDLGGDTRKGIVHDDDVAATLEAWHGAVKTGEPYEIEYRLRRASDGSFRWFLARAVPVRDQSGKIVQWVGSATDIDTTRRATENMRFTVAAYGALYTIESVDEVCRRLVDIAIEHVSDWAIIVLLDDAEDSYRVAALAHRDESRLAEVQQYAGVYPPRAGGGIDNAVRTQKGIFASSVSEEALRASAYDERHFELMKSLRLQSVMIAPIVGERGKAYGAISLFATESGRSYDEQDLTVLETIARRAGKSIDQALLLEQERRLSNQLRFLSDVSDVLFSAFEVQAMLENFVGTVVPARADAAVVLTYEEPEILRVSAVHGSGAQAQELAATLRGTRPFKVEAERRAIARLQQHHAFITSVIEERDVSERLWEYVAPAVRQLSLGSAVTIPLHTRGALFGAVLLYRFAGSAPYRERDLPMFSDLGRRLSIAIAQAETVERERRISTELQRAMLPDPAMLPNDPGMEFSVVYRPSAREAEVGGDWYDAVRLPDGSISVSVGDVSGRGLRAAGLMGKLRQALGVVPLYESDPARMLDAVDTLLRARGSAAIATAFMGIISPDRKTFRYANAGHPYPILRRNGHISFLSTDGLPLGLRDQAAGETKTVSLHDAELLVLYTDGLVESTHDIIEGEARLALAARSEAIAFVRNAADFIASTCLDAAYLDDAAVLTVTFGRPKRWAFDAENAQAAQGARAQFVQYLRQEGAEGDFDAAEIIFGELIGNVVRHSPGPIEVQVQWKSQVPRLHVTDRGNGFTARFKAPENPMKENGRGLFIVHALGSDVRVEYVPRFGTHIGVDLPLRKPA